MRRSEKPGSSETEAGSVGPTQETFVERRSPPSRQGERRAAVSRAVAKHRLEEFHELLATLAGAVFGQQATVVAHLRTVGGREWITFVVDAADPTAVVSYEEFLPREQAFWTAYTLLTKPPQAPFIVAIRPARGWCRVEALAPLFCVLPASDTLA